MVPSLDGAGPPEPTPISFGEGQTIFGQGNLPPRWYTLREGVVRLCRAGGERRQVTGFLYAGDVFGPGAYRNPERAEAVTRVDCLAVGAASDGASDPHALAAAHSGLRAVQSAVHVHGRRSAAERLAAFLLDTADRLGAGTSLALPMPWTDIADYMGVSFHTLSRAFLLLAEKGLIDLDGLQEVRFLDLAGLKTMADGLAKISPARQ